MVQNTVTDAYHELHAGSVRKEFVAQTQVAVSLLSTCDSPPYHCSIFPPSKETRGAIVFHVDYPHVEKLVTELNELAETPLARHDAFNCSYTGRINGVSVQVHPGPITRWNYKA
ncbi:MAG: hypothetical protein K0S20_256 [Patescibacteria group bacterium]|jgi:hypothetical protein|nr:hypothetical protein [Patescibacteria group bacterium]